MVHRNEQQVHPKKQLWRAARPDTRFDWWTAVIALNEKRHSWSREVSEKTTNVMLGFITSRLCSFNRNDSLLKCVVDSGMLQRGPAERLVDTFSLSSCVKAPGKLRVINSTERHSVICSPQKVFLFLVSVSFCPYVLYLRLSSTFTAASERKRVPIAEDIALVTLLQHAKNVRTLKYT